MPRKVVASTYVTLDGYVDEPGQWALPFRSVEASDFKSKELIASEALLLGRVTYEGFAAAWPAMEGTGEFGDLLIGGSGELIDYLSAHDLIDEYRLMIHPIILGGGTKRLFGGAPRATLKLVDTLAFPSGVVVNTYWPVLE